MLQKTFELKAPSPKSRILQVELGRAHLTLTCFNAAFKPIGSLEHFNFKATENQDWQQLWAALKRESGILAEAIPTEHVLVTWENDQIQPIPTAIFQPGVQEAAFQYHKESITAPKDSYKHLSDLAAGYTFAYSVPLAAYEAVTSHFPAVIHQHKQAAIVRSISNFSDQYPMRALLVFYQDHFILTTFKDNHLQLVVSRPFNHGADIVYHLLSAIKQAGCSPDNCCVYLSGLIDGDSTLYKEIYKFVPVIDIDRMQGMDFSAGHSDYPSHFFVPFFKYVQYKPA